MPSVVVSVLSPVVASATCVGLFTFTGDVVGLAPVGSSPPSTPPVQTGVVVAGATVGTSIGGTVDAGEGVLDRVNEGAVDD
jgi:hypothetical protein